MKKIFTFIFAALMSASMFAQLAAVPTVQDVASAGYDVANARVICLYFDEQVCNDIVWVGTYRVNEVGNWSTNVEELSTFESLENYPGWYVVEVDDARAPQADQTIDPFSNCCVGKPVQLRKDGSFYWDFQTGDAEAWINMAQPGTKQHYIFGGYVDEADICWNEYGVYIYEVAYFKSHNTPCGEDKPKHDYTITAYLPEFCEEIAAYADSAQVMGGFDGWTNGVWMERKVDKDSNDYWCAELKDVEEGTEFKLRCSTDWSIQPQLNGQDLANEILGENTAIVLQYNGEGYSFKACAAPVEYKYTEYENWQIKYGPDWTWSEKMTKVADGLYEIGIIWGNTGFNIKSDDNPIKQDWYALDDPAVTVADGLVEGEPAKVTLRIVDDKTLVLNIVPTLTTIPTVQDVVSAGYDVANARVICLYFDEQVCNDIVWAGSYNGWNTDSPADMLHFEPLEGFAGWYVVEVYDDSDVVMGKPVQLKKDGSFDWQFQSGDVDAWLNMAQPDSKTATFAPGYGGEADCTWPELGVYIYEVAYFKNHNTPCGEDKPKHNYTITAYLPEFCAEIEAYADSVRVMGGFDGWTDGIWMEKRVDENLNLYYYAELTDVEEGTEFKLRFCDDWSVQPQLNGLNLGNETFGENTNIVLQYNGEGYSFKACAEYKYTEYENWQIKYGPDWAWTDNMTKVADGLYEIGIIWGNTGLNVKSDENPIKQDWYPLDDPAVTVANDLVEGELAKVTLRIVDDKTLTITIDVIPEEISVADALAIAQTLNPEPGKTLSTSARYDVRGYVVEISSMGAQEKFYLADSPEATHRNFQVYKCTIPEGAVVEKGSYVSVVGYISNYKGGTYNSIGIDFGQLTVIKLESVVCVTEHGTSTGAGKYLKGDTCTLTVTPDYGYHFVQWNDSVTDNPRSFIVTQDTTFTAVFAKNQYLISVEAEHGVVSGGGYYEYQSYAQLSATADEHYHFVKWSDGNTSNPRTISVTEDKTYTAIFALDQFTISATATHGAVTGTGKYDYGQEITLTVVPDFCYEFAGWNDGNTDNPRKVTVLGDAQYSAQCKQLQMVQGSCGVGVYWALDLQTGILTISGDGAMDNYTSANQTPWYDYLSFTTFSSLIIEDGVTHIGNYAFYGLRGLITVSMPNSVATIGQYAFAECQDLEKVAFGAGLQSIGDYAFYNDIRIEEMTCLASRTPDVSANTFTNVSHFAWVYVQSEYFHKYEVNMYWNVFVLKTIEAEPAVVQEDDVTVTPSTDNATIVWPSDDAAAEYTLEITKDGVVFCTLRFNAQGQLIGIAFAPSRDGELRTMSNAEMTVNGWSFTVTGLNPGSTYSYTVDVVDAQKQSIHQYTGSFTTTGGVVTSLPTLMSTSASGKMLYNGHLYILRDGNLYTATGARVK